MFLLVVTMSSMLLAAIMSVIAWRIAAEERKRSDARIAALAAEIHAPAAAAAARSSGARVKTFPAPQPPWDDLPLRSPEPASSGPIMFSAEGSRSSARRLAAIVGVLAVGGVLAFVVLSSRAAVPSGPPTASRSATTTAPTSATTGAPAPAASPGVAPLELVALGDDRDSDRLTVRGVVRNPASGRPLERLAVVVLAFRTGGGFLASNRAIIEPSVFRPDREVTFVVTVPGASGVGRYRVSFRSDDRVVPHLDRRETPK